MELTPKQKAKELYDSFSKHAKYWDCYNDAPLEIDHVKQCALITVNEIIKIKTLWFQKDTKDIDFWKEVKEELLKV